jgi:hypothetical protein
MTDTSGTSSSRDPYPTDSTRGPDPTLTEDTSDDGSRGTDPTTGGPLSGMPGFDPALGGASNSQVLMRNRYSRHTSNALPSWVLDSYGIDQLPALVGQMTEDEVLTLKQRLWTAGVLKASAPPTNGAADETVKTALQSAAFGAAAQGLDLDTYLDMETSRNAGALRDAAIDIYDIPGTVAKLMNQSVKDLGRPLTDDEISQILASATGPQPDVAPNSYDAAQLEASRQGAYIDPTGAPMAAPMNLSGGGPDSTAIQFGKSLARSFGLSVVQDFTPTGQVPFDGYRDGRGFSVSGAPEQMHLLHEWAQDKIGDDKLFTNVQARYDNPGSDTPTSIAFEVRQGALRPEITANAGPEDDVTRFLDAVKRPGNGWAEYRSWEGEGSHRRGAYGVSDQIWDYYSARLGIDNGDHSPHNQDRVAAVYAQDLYSRYGNWEDVAYAFRANEAEANKRNDWRRYQAGSPDSFDHSEDDWVHKAMVDFGNRNVRRDYGGPVGGDAYSQMFGDGAIPGMSWSQAMRSNDPRFWDFRAQRAYRSVMNPKIYAEQIAGLLYQTGGAVTPDMLKNNPEAMRVMLNPAATTMQKFLVLNAMAGGRNNQRLTPSDF